MFWNKTKPQKCMCETCTQIDGILNAAFNGPRYRKPPHEAMNLLRKCPDRAGDVMKTMLARSNPALEMRRILHVEPCETCDCLREIMAKDKADDKKLEMIYRTGYLSICPILAGDIFDTFLEEKDRMMDSLYTFHLLEVLEFCPERMEDFAKVLLPTPGVKCLDREDLSMVIDIFKENKDLIFPVAKKLLVERLEWVAGYEEEELRKIYHKGTRDGWWSDESAKEDLWKIIKTLKKLCR